MIRKKQIKIGLDILMSVLLLFLMAFQVTGDEYHEWIGTGMLVLFLLHNGLNIGWYKALFKGKYSLQRVFRTLVNILVLVAILLTGYSGIVMSRYVFDFLPISGGMATARKMHLAGSYWSFVFMSIHLGMHWSMVIGRIRVGIKANSDSNNNWMTWLLRVVALVIAVYGAILFGRAEIFSNMLLRNEFAILDYEKRATLVIFEQLIMMGTWVYVGHYLTKALGKLSVAGKRNKERMMQAGVCIIAAVAVIFCGVITTPMAQESQSWSGTVDNEETTEANENTSEVESEIVSEGDTQQIPTEQTQMEQTPVTPTEGFILITGGTFSMGSPESENWRSPDEVQHTVTVNDFYMSPYELTQEEYQTVMGNNPSMFSGSNFPVENISWLDAVTYCNARSELEGLNPVYIIEGNQVSWDRGADGYRLPTEAEWEYACRAGTETPFNTETSISPEESNYYGHYPYEIEGNYFAQGNLSTQPGRYRETTVEVDSFEANAFGLYNMHGNVSEWVWDYYGAYETEDATDPVGPQSGTLKVYRGGGWNDFAKNMRSAYRATLEADKGSFNLGIRLVRNAVAGKEDIIGSVATATETGDQNPENILIVYFSWGGNTEGIAEEIQAQTGADIFEITLVEPYSSNYNTVLDEAQRDQNIQARPEIVNHIDNMGDYDTIIIGYPNWWASIPMPIASFLEEYDFSGKTIIPFCSHGGGRFGQSLTAIAKLTPYSTMGEGLSIHYSGGSTLSADIAEWLEINGVLE